MAVMNLERNIPDLPHTLLLLLLLIFLPLIHKIGERDWGNDTQSGVEPTITALAIANTGHALNHPSTKHPVPDVLMGNSA